MFFFEQILIFMKDFLEFIVSFILCKTQKHQIKFIKKKEIAFAEIYGNCLFKKKMIYFFPLCFYYAVK